MIRRATGDVEFGDQLREDGKLCCRTTFLEGIALVGNGRAHLVQSPYTKHGEASVNVFADLMGVQVEAKLLASTPIRSEHLLERLLELGRQEHAIRTTMVDELLEKHHQLQNMARLDSSQVLHEAWTENGVEALLMVTVSPCPQSTFVLI